MKLRSLTVFMFFLTACLSAAGQVQNGDFRFKVDTDPVFFVSNPAALSAFRGHISVAEAAFSKENGGLIALHQSPDSYTAGASTESYVSISDRLSFHGKLRWSYFSGQQMGGPVFIDPDFNPVSFLESSTANLGRKNHETYALTGAMAYRFSDKWSAGLSLDYESADQTKVKDPRFSSILMDMKVKAGLSFRPSERLMLGLALLYRSNIEQLRGGIYGTTEKQYFIYADKGGYYGTMAELTGEYNYVPLNNFRPMNNSFAGFGLQIAGKSFSSELELMYRSGFWGTKSSSKPIFFEFSGIVASYKGRFLKRHGDGMHRLALDLDYEMLGNNENIFSYVTPPGQDTRVEYSGSNHILDRHRASAELSYVWYSDLDGYLPRFRAGATVSGKMVSRSTVLYPFTRKSDTESLLAELFADKSIFAGRSVFTVSLSGAFRTGFGTPKEDAVLVPGASSGYISFDDYLYRQFEYDTASALSAGAGFRYSYVVSARLVPYIKVSDNFSAMLHSPEYLSGGTRNVALITLGCSF